MKNVRLFLMFIVIIISLQSCNLFFKSIQGNFCEQWGYITDTNGVGIPNVKITVLKSYGHLATPEETNRFFYTDNNGFYYIYIDNSDSVYYMKMTHDDYIYPMLNIHRYPQIAYAHLQQEDEERNYKMVKKGKVKIEGKIMCDGGTPYFIPDVKISILRRSIENSEYPDTIGVKTFTDNNGYYYIEYDGNENYDFFIKPEKDGYYYEWREFDYAPAPNIDPGYITAGSIKIFKEK